MTLHEKHSMYFTIQKKISQTHYQWKTPYQLPPSISEQAILADLGRKSQNLYWINNCTTELLILNMTSRISYHMTWLIFVILTSTHHVLSSAASAGGSCISRALPLPSSRSQQYILTAPGQHHQHTWKMFSQTHPRQCFAITEDKLKRASPKHNPANTHKNMSFQSPVSRQGFRVCLFVFSQAERGFFWLISPWWHSVSYGNISLALVWSAEHYCMKILNKDKGNWTGW